MTERLERSTIRLHAEGLRLVVQLRHMTFDRGELLGEQCLFAILHERRAELFPTDLCGVVENVLDALIGEQELCRRLRADTGHARNVVRAVAHQPFHINQANRREAVLLLERRCIIRLCLADALLRQKDGELRANELQGIAVARNDARLHALCRRLRGERPDDVVRLVVVPFEKGDAECLRQLLQQRNLGDQLLRRLIPRPLVVGIERRAKRRTALVERDDDLCRRKLLQELYEHHGKAMYCIRMNPARIRRKLQRIERAKEETAPVNDRKNSAAHRFGLSSSSRRMRMKI